MLTAVVVAASMLNEARMMVEVRIDLLSAKTRLVINCVCEVLWWFVDVELRAATPAMSRPSFPNLAPRPANATNGCAMTNVEESM